MLRQSGCSCGLHVQLQLWLEEAAWFAGPAVAFDAASGQHTVRAALVPALLRHAHACISHLTAG